jgi:hypothetical protein
MPQAHPLGERAIPDDVGEEGAQRFGTALDQWVMLDVVRLQMRRDGIGGAPLIDHDQMKINHVLEVAHRDRVFGIH